MEDERFATDPSPEQTAPTAGSAEHAQENPDEWVTEDQPMTEAQATLLRCLCKEAGEPFEADLSKDHAAQRIDALQKRLRGPEPRRVLMDDQTDG
jgi:hypothetical protein